MRPILDPETAARHELATPFRYHLQVTVTQESWWQRVVDAFGRWWNSLFAHVHGSAAAESIAGDVLFVLAASLVIYALARFVLRASLRSAALPADAEALVAERAEHRFAREAVAAAGHGDFLAATRLTLRAAVALLDLRGALHDDASATVWELRRQAASLGDAIAQPFGEIAGTYTQGVYAQKPVEEFLWVRAWAAYEALRVRRDA